MNSAGACRGAEQIMTHTKTPIFTNQTNLLMEQVVERGNLKEALERVEKNKGAHGVDRMPVTELRKYLRKHWNRIKQELLDGTYKPMPVRRFEIPKTDGGTRQLGIPTVLDRFIQQAIQQVLTPIFDPTFSENSYGFRKGKSARQAVYKAQSYIQNGQRTVVDIDLEKFFDRVNHDILMTKIMKQIDDKRIHKLIRKYLQAGVMINGCCVANEEGTPQGGPISPLLANIMLNDLDKELAARGHSFVRYADDCNIYVASKRAGERVYQSISKFIKERLKLKVNEQKSAVDKPCRRKFLGFSFTNEVKVRLRMAPRTIVKFKDKIRDLTRRRWSISLDERLKALNSYLIGWSGYFGIVQTKSKFADLDKWIRRRLRACLLKQWKHCKTKRANLISRGISERESSELAYSRKGDWRLSAILQMNMAFDLAYWRRQGLVALVDRNNDLLQRASL